MMPAVSPGVVVTAELEADEYHADPCPQPSLSSTRARRMTIDGCARIGRPGNGAAADIYTGAKDAGTAIHQLILQNSDEIEVIERKTYHSKEAKAERDAARANGRVPIKRHEYDPLEVAARGIESTLRDDYGLALAHDPDNGAYSELVILHQVETECGPIWARTRIDHVKFYQKEIVAFDLKVRSKRGDASERRMSENVARDGYDVQAAAYDQAIQAAWPAFAGRTEWVWVYAESCPPFLVSAARWGGIHKQRGRRLWKEACEMWGRGIYYNEWPGYRVAEYLPVPGWLEYQEGEYE